MNRTSFKSMVAVGSLLAITAATSQAAVLLAGWDNGPTAGYEHADFTATSVASLTRTSRGSNDGTWGDTALDSAPDATIGTVFFSLNVGDYHTFTLTNDSLFDYTIDEIHFDFMSNNQGGTHALKIYTGTGNTGTLLSTVGTYDGAGQGGDGLNSGTFSNYADKTRTIGATIAAGSSLTYTIYSETKAIDIDNVAFSGTAVPEPSSTALLGLGGFALILRRRK